MAARRGRTMGPTRRQILGELCGGRRTANELAQTFGISGSAVRAHLQRLSDEGLVDRGVERRGVGKPSHVYELTADGHSLLSRAYAPVLGAILKVLETQHDKTTLDRVLRAAGRSLAPDPAPARSARHAAGLAAAALEDLGAHVEVRRYKSGYAIQGRCCPLASLSTEAPSLCMMVESMMSTLSGMRVRERCDRAVPPRCRFEVQPS